MPPSAIQREVLQTIDLGDKLKVMFTVEIPPGATTPRHWHHGVESGYVIEGCAQLEVDGQRPQQFTKGESFSVPATVVHRGLPCEGQSTKVLSVYVIDKGKPQSVMAAP
ncbi:MAG: cupin domain-containing protein [Betaproteobacteria bacterium]|nr:cupin domain-containing protein [Betaproteobacteria bacterium]